MAVPLKIAKPGEVHCCPALHTDTSSCCQLVNKQHCPGGAKAETASWVSPDPDLDPPSTGTVQKSEQKDRRCQRPEFHAYLVIPAKDTEMSECSHNVPVLAALSQHHRLTGEPDGSFQGLHIPAAPAPPLLTLGALCYTKQ